MRNGRGQLCGNRAMIQGCGSAATYPRSVHAQMSSSPGNIEPSQHPNPSYGPKQIQLRIKRTGNSNVEGTSARGVEWETSCARLRSISGFRQFHDNKSAPLGVQIIRALGR